MELCEDLSKIIVISKYSMLKKLKERKYKAEQLTDW